MSGFLIEIGELPRDVGDFTGHLRAGLPAIKVRHPGDDAWSTAPFTSPESLAGANLPDLGTLTVDGIEVMFAETTSKGSTVRADGTVEEWKRPAIAYASMHEMDYFAEGDGATDPDNSTFYIFAKHRR